MVKYFIGALTSVVEDFICDISSLSQGDSNFVEGSIPSVVWDITTPPDE